MTTSLGMSHGEPLQPASGTKAWDYGLALFAAGQQAEALAILLSVVAHSPGDLALRQTLRELQRQASQASATAEPSPLLTEVWLEIRQAKRGRTPQLVEWDQIDQAVERGLTLDPRDADLHVELGHACLARGYREVAGFAFACALEIAPERADAQEQLRRLSEA